ncbi:MAG: hypothetical protein KIT74_11045 [Fimbriimonadales bacterium]|nr:hypothetical protein [Fimbriimonadales bacterium]
MNRRMVVNLLLILGCGLVGCLLWLRYWNEARQLYPALYINFTEEEAWIFNYPGKEPDLVVPAGKSMYLNVGYVKIGGWGQVEVVLRPSGRTTYVDFGDRDRVPLVSDGLLIVEIRNEDFVAPDSKN